MREAVIIAAARSGIGKFGGSLSNISPSRLGEFIVKGVLDKTKIPVKLVDQVVLGCVLQAGAGQNIARQVAIYSGLPNTVLAMTINKVCGSGLEAVNLAAGFIMLGDADVIVAGGVENMSASPYLIEKARWGLRMGDSVLIDSMVKDVLSDVFNDCHMGITAENIAQAYKISRKEQDEFAVLSQKKAAAALRNKKFIDEIIPIEIDSKKGKFLFREDEFPRPDTTIESLVKLKPAFKKDGTVTAGNSSGINDGTAAVVVMEKTKAEDLGVKPLAKIISYASSGVDPSIMGIAPVYATKKALKKANLSLKDIELIEANEAFASQTIAVERKLKWDREIVNVNGGAIALGHPVGASGTRILVTLLHEMERRDLELGLATICIGGGMGIATIVQRL